MPERLPKPKPAPRPKPPQPPRPQTPAPLFSDQPTPTRPPPEGAPARPSAPAAAPAVGAARQRAATGPGVSAPAAGARGGPGPSAATKASTAAAEQAYLAELQRAIGRLQRFPDAARERRKTGVATVAFVVEANGQIGQVRIAQSAGDPDLDRAALETLKRLGRFKPIPDAIGRTSWPMRVPIRFNLR